MSIAKLNYSIQEKIEAAPYTEGFIYIATDSKKIYVDLEGERLLLSPDAPEEQVIVSSEQPSQKVPIWIQEI